MSYAHARTEMACARLVYTAGAKNTFISNLVLQAAYLSSSHRQSAGDNVCSRYWKPLVETVRVR